MSKQLKWIVQQNLFNEVGYNDFVGTIEKMGFDYIPLKVVPFSGELIPEINETEGIVAYGSTTLMRISVGRKWNPGVFFNDNFTQLQCVNHWGEEMLNAVGLVVPFSQINLPPDNHEFFIRPNDDLKSFSGEVISRTNFNEWRAKVLAYESVNLKPETLCIVAPVQPIVREYRFFVVDAKVITGSLYKIGNTVRSDPHVEPMVYEYAQCRVNEWQPADAFVIDVAQMIDGSLKVIEINCLNSAGFYACDTSKIIQAIADLYERKMTK